MKTTLTTIKTVGTWKNARPATRRFYYNRNWQCLLETTENQPSIHYTWGLRYIDDLICRHVGLDRLYPLPDPNWNVAALVDSIGIPVERYTYNAFGKLNIYDGNFTPRSSSNYNWTRTFTGQVLDAATNLLLYRNRFYHSDLGRFLTRDPIGYNGMDENLYRYVKNASVFLTDSMGEEPQWNPYPWPTIPDGYLGNGCNGRGSGPCEGEDAETTPFFYAERKNNIKDWYPEHAYIQVGQLDESGKPKIGTVGIGISGQIKQGMLPDNSESSFRPKESQPLCRSKSGKLSYGMNQGKPACDATTEEIRDCLRSIPARADYSSTNPCHFYVCWTWAKEAISLCGLMKCGKSTYPKWKPEPPNWDPQP